jgi:pimeloyl-ACP methyl ester carboxylesterase
VRIITRRLPAAGTGIELTYWDAGSGVPLVCLHGGMGVDASALSVPGILTLAGQGVRLIIPDQRGHGRLATLPA